MKTRFSLFILIIIFFTYASRSTDEMASAMADRNPLFTIKLKQTPFGFYQAHGISFPKFSREELLSIERALSSC